MSLFKSRGYKLRLLGRGEIYYSEGPRNMLIGFEDLINSQYDMVVFVSTIRQWGPPFHFDVISEEKREEIISNIKREFCTSKIWFQRGVYPPAKERDYVAIDVLAINRIEVFTFSFEHVSPGYRHGVSLGTEGHFRVLDKKIKSSLLVWRDLFPDSFEFTVRGNGELSVSNVWDKGDGKVQIYQGSAGMKVQDIPNGKRYYCNDGDPDTDFDDLVFRIVLVPPKADSRI